MINLPTDISQYYFYLAVFATTLFVIKLILFTVFGGDSEVFADFNTETETDVSFNFFSVQSVISFLMGFGWMGYAGLSQFEFTQLLNLAIAFCVGFIFMFVSAALMFGTKKLEKNVKKDKKSSKGFVGKAYTNFAPHAPGQIEIEISGQLSIVNAVNDSDFTIGAFDRIKVKRVENDTIFIEKVI